VSLNWELFLSIALGIALALFIEQRISPSSPSPSSLPAPVKISSGNSVQDYLDNY